ncbi:MAG TPA: outer membrane beta-barrel protein, partial [Cyclobacteriaceae bacterium]|nr:outer membrane beta-barrel protein [Cyclobacteriaceae bacterium]
DFRNELMSNIPIPSSNSAFVGIFADIPVRMTHFSLRSEITINNNNFVAAQSNIDGDTDVFITLLTVQSPVSIRYTLPTVIWRPFFNVGPNFSYNIKNTSSIYRTRIENNVIIIDKPVQYKLLSDYSIGYCLGLGFQYNLTYKKTISTEFRYCRTLTPSDNKLMQNSIDFLFGFTF